jgi:hypothetical protein
MNRLEDLREWLMSQIDGSEETRGDDSLISHFINQIDALPPSETGPIPASKTQAKRFAAQMEPRGCPTPGACSCPGTIPAAEREKVMTAHALAQSIVERATVETPRTDAAVVTMLRLDGDADVVVDAYFARTLERELIDLKQRLLPQFQGRAQRAEKENADLRGQLAARSATGATRGKSDFEDGFDAGFAKAMLDLDPTNKAPRVEVAEPDRPDWARQLPGAELYDRAARYEYLRTLNPRQFAALYDEALHGDRFDDLVDRYRMKGGE